MTEILQSINKNAILKSICNEIDVKKMESIKTDFVCHLVNIGKKNRRCVFFGQSSEKSSLINAILDPNILPIGNGRTSSRFIKIDSSEKDTTYGVILFNILKKILYKCKLSKTINTSELSFEDVQLLDSPDLNISKNNYEWINTNCLDSDIFVYVVDGQGTINDSERSFFKEVVSFIKNPNILVVINKWDQCDAKERHYAIVKNFLCDDFKLECDPRKKTFFLSATEQLDNYGKERQDDLKKTETMKEFKIFFDTSSEETSTIAIINKFCPHLDKVDEYLNGIAEGFKEFQKLTKPGVSGNNSNDIKVEITKVIKEFFDKIIKEGAKEIKIQYLGFVNSIIAGKTVKQRIEDCIHEEFVKKLQDIFVDNVEELISKLKGVLLSCSGVPLSDEVLNKYFPLSFQEHTTMLVETLTSNIKRRDLQIQNKYIFESIKIKNALVPIMNKDIAAICGIAALDLNGREQIVAIAVFALMAKSSKWLYTNWDNGNIDYLQKITETILKEYIEESFRKCQNKIETEINRRVDTFCNDLDNARRLIKEMDVAKLTFDKMYERFKIMNLDSQSPIAESSKLDLKS